MSYYFDEERGRYFKVVNGAQGTPLLHKYHNNSIQIQKRTQEFREKEQKQELIRKKNKNDLQLAHQRRTFLYPSGLLNLKLGTFDTLLRANNLEALRLRHQTAVVDEVFLTYFGVYSVHVASDRKALKFYDLDRCVLTLRLPKSYNATDESDFLELNNILNSNIACFAHGDKGILVSCIMDENYKPFISVFQIKIGISTVVQNYTSALVRFCQSYKLRNNGVLISLMKTYVLPETSNKLPKQLLAECNKKLANFKDGHSKSSDSTAVVNEFISKQMHQPFEYFESDTKAAFKVRSIQVFASQTDFGFIINGHSITIGYSKLPNLFNLRLSKVPKGYVVNTNGKTLVYQGNTITLLGETREMNITHTFNSYINHVVPIAGKLFVITKNSAFLLDYDFTEQDLGPVLNNTAARQVVHTLGNEFVVLNEDLTLVVIYSISMTAEGGMHKRRLKFDPPHTAKRLIGMSGLLRLLYLHGS